MKTKYFLVLSILSFGLLSSVQAFFKDVDVTHPYYYSIRYLHDNRIVEGYEYEDEFYYRPLQPVSRAAALKILILASEYELDQSGQLEFPDIETGQWYFPYIKTAFDKEIVSGFTDGNFYPGAQVSVAQLLKMTFKSFKAPYDFDEEEQDNWFDSYISLAEEFDIVEDGINPHKQLTRGEVAEIIYRTKLVVEGEFKAPYVYGGFGYASYYGGNFHGRTTASGEIYNKDDLTAAHRTLPFGTRLKVTYQDKSVIVRVNDRGPYHKNRIIDLSEEAFKTLAPVGTGILPVDFVLYTKDDEGEKSVPSYVRDTLSDSSKNPVIPDEVAKEVVYQEPQKSLSLRPQYIDETVNYLGETFFPNAKLERSIPQTVYKGDVILFAGRATERGAKEAIVFLASDSNTKLADSFYKAEMSGNVFRIPVLFDEIGEFSVGLVFDEVRKSRVEKIKVLPRPSREYYRTPNQSGELQDDFILTTNSEDEQVRIEFPKHNNFNEYIYKLLIQQQGVQLDIRVEGGLEFINIPYSLLDKFYEEESLLFDLYRAPTKEGRLGNQSENWSKIASKSVLLRPGFRDTVSGDVEVYNFPQFHKQTGTYLLKGQKVSDIDVRSTGYVTHIEDEVKTIPIDFEEGGTFTMPLSFTKYGTYIVEIISTEGEVLYNRAAYVYQETSLPTKEWRKPVGLQPSRSSMLAWVNSVRTRYRTSAVGLDNELNTFAQEYADFMADNNFIGHTAPDGTTFGDRVKSSGLRGELGENLSYGTNLELAIQGLEDSGSHLQNMVNSRWNNVGIGIAQTPTGDYYIAHVFGR